MTRTPDAADGPRAPERAASPRLRLARMAADAVAGVQGVDALDPGPQRRYVTHGGGEAVAGVIAIADLEPDRYAVSVYVRAHLTDLHVLADEVRAAIRTGADAQGLGPVLGDVRVAITDIDDGTSSA